VAGSDKSSVFSKSVKCHDLLWKFADSDWDNGFFKCGAAGEHGNGRTLLYDLGGDSDRPGVPGGALASLFCSIIRIAHWFAFVKRGEP
jgi:hypothetical protein